MSEKNQITKSEYYQLLGLAIIIHNQSKIQESISESWKSILDGYEDWLWDVSYDHNPENKLKDFLKVKKIKVTK